MTTTGTDIYAETYYPIYNRLIAAGATKWDAADEAGRAAARAWVADRDAK